MAPINLHAEILGGSWLEALVVRLECVATDFEGWHQGVMSYLLVFITECFQQLVPGDGRIKIVWSGRKGKSQFSLLVPTTQRLAHVFDDKFGNIFITECVEGEKLKDL
jgi:hypothetical protein